MIEITGNMIHRSKSIGLSDPCVICGGKFGAEFGVTDACGHTQAEIADVLKRIKAMPKGVRVAKLKGH